jgi:hypothetical protein
MTNKNAQTLTLVAGIIFVITAIMQMLSATFSWLFLPALLASLAPVVDPTTFAMLTTLFNWLILIIPLITLIAAIPTLIVAILILRWRHTPELHKMSLIVIGILGILFLGTLPGILTLVAGILVEETPKKPID